MAEVATRWLLAATLSLFPLTPRADEPGEANEAFVVTRYQVVITPDFADHSLSGEETIRIRSDGADDLRAISFSPNALSVDRVTANGEPAVATNNGKQWIVPLRGVLRRGGAMTLRIDFHGVPARGVTFSQGTVYTSYFACDWMFCNQDRPGEKAPIALTVVVPRAMTTIGQGVLTKVMPASPGLVAQTWSSGRPYSSYLYAFAAGAFLSLTERRGPTELVYLSDGASPAELKTLFAATGPMLDFLRDKAGVPFPWPRYTQLLVPGSDAQEAVSSSIIGREEVSTTLRDPQDDWAIVHELAHQWWGNLITCKRWNELWLNEGVTTFMVAAWKEQRWGRAAYDAEMDIARRRADAAAKAGFDKPLAYSGVYPSLGVRRDIQYFKAELFLDELRSRLGDDAFWRGLRDYTRAHAGGTVESRDFQAAMQQASGRDLSEVFDRWVYGTADPGRLKP